MESLTSDLLEQIFLRISSPDDLARASAACVAFRRLIADPKFLLRYRSLHPPLLLGLVIHDPDGSGFQPAEAPHPSAALARAVARAGDFSFRDYLPRVTGAYWSLCDVLFGRLLFIIKYDHGRHSEGKEFFNFFPELAVYDPLARRCLLLPPIPDDILASVQVQRQDFRGSYAHLVPSGDEEDGTSFRVLALTDCKEILVPFIFSSATGHWSAATSVSWDALSIPLGKRSLFWTSKAYGCFYWKIGYQNKWLKFDIGSIQFFALDIPIDHGYFIIGEASEGRLKFDIASMQFSALDIPIHHGIFIIGEASEGRLGMFFICGTSLYCYIIRQVGGERFHQLEIDNIIHLPEGYDYYVHGIYEGHIFISGNRLMDRERTCFSIEIKTSKAERVCQCDCGVYPYFGFLPSMSQRRI